MEDIKCSTCGKDLIMHTYDGLEDGNKDKAYVALSFKFDIGEESEREFVQNLVGEYKIGKGYRFCPSCVLKAFGAKIED